MMETCISVLSYCPSSQVSGLRAIKNKSFCEERDLLLIPFEKLE